MIKYYRFAEVIEKSLNIVFLCEMVGCTIIICFLEFGVLKVLLLDIILVCKISFIGTSLL